MENLEKLINEKFVTVNTKLDGISGRLDKINGSVQQHEKVISEALIERAANRQLQTDKFKEIDALEIRTNLLEKEEVKHFSACPIAPTIKDNQKKIRKLEDESLSNKSVKKFISLVFISGLALGGIIIGIVELLIKI